MDRIKDLLAQFDRVSQNPDVQLTNYLNEGRKAIGVFPYYVPEELVHAADMIPFGIWGAEGSVRAAGKYFPAFYCTIARMGLELALSGKLDGLSAVIMPSICDTLRPFTQNFKAAKPDLPLIFLAHPQNRRTDFGVSYTVSEYRHVRSELERIAGAPITDAAITAAIRDYNDSRRVRREFVRLAGMHPEVISPEFRSAVLKSAYFMRKPEHTALLAELNETLNALQPQEWRGIKLVTSGIIADNKNLLRLFERYDIAIVSDDIAHESRSFRVDVPESASDMPHFEAAEQRVEVLTYAPESASELATDYDPLTALAVQFAMQGDDSLLYEPELTHRGRHLTELVRNSGAQGVVFLMMQFCDPEELDHPNVKNALKEVGIPSVTIGYDQQMRDFGQATTSLETFAEMLR